jgi:hypothetical protein
MFRIQRSTLKDHINNMSKEGEHIVAMNIGRTPVLPVKIENEVMNYYLLKRIATTTKSTSPVSYGEDRKLLRSSYEIFCESTQHVP